MADKISFPTIEVTLWDENGKAKENILIRPAPFNKIAEVDRLQRKLMEAYEKYKGSLGKLLGNATVYGDMEKIAELVQVVGKKDSGFDLDNLYQNGDIVQLGQIFFSESVKADMRSPGYTEMDLDGQKVKAYNYPEHRLNPLPSGIARIHDLAFFAMMVEIREKAETTTEAPKDNKEDAEGGHRQAPPLKGGEPVTPEPLKAVATAS